MFQQLLLLHLTNIPPKTPVFPLWFEPEKLIQNPVTPEPILFLVSWVIRGWEGGWGKVGKGGADQRRAAMQSGRTKVNANPPPAIRVAPFCPFCFWMTVLSAAPGYTQSLLEWFH